MLAFFLIRLVPGDPIETLAGERGIDPQRHEQLRDRIRLRPADFRPVRDLSGARAAGRSRQVDDHAGIRPDRILDAVSGDHRAGVLRHHLRARHRPARRNARGHQTKLHLRPWRDGRLAGGLFHADLLVGPDPDPALLGAVRSHARLGSHRRPLLHRADHRIPADRHAVCPTRKARSGPPFAISSCRPSCWAPCRLPSSPA